MASKPINPYLRTQILTANPEQLRMMLYDGVLRFCRAARQAMVDKQIEQSFDNLMRAQKIVLELSTSLRHETAPELCDKLSALYTYIYKLLVEANMKREIKPLDEAIELLAFERETWQLLMQRLTDTGQSGDIQTAQDTALSSLRASA